MSDYVAEAEAYLRTLDAPGCRLLPYAPPERVSMERLAEQTIRGDADHRAGHPMDRDDPEALHIVRENCGACVLAGYGENDPEVGPGPNYSAWVHVYLASRTPIPERWREAFEAEVRTEPYPGPRRVRAHELITWGVTFA